MPRYRYSGWDGTQGGFDLAADDVLRQLTDDLLYHGDLHAALKRLVQQGFEHDQERVQGVRELLERLRERRREMLEQHDLGGVYDEMAQQLDEIVAQERATLDDLEKSARQSGDSRRQEVTGEAMQSRRLQLDLVPNDLAGKVRELSGYDWVSADAQQRFDALVQRLREQLMQSWLDQAGESFADMDAAKMAEAREMMAALNSMLEQQSRNEQLDPSFAQFMERFGDFFPGDPQTLDELLAMLAAQVSAMQQLVNSMTPEQRAQLDELMRDLLGDMDLRFEMDRLRSNLEHAFPQLPWQRRYSMTGDDPLGLSQAAQMMSELGDIDQLENLLRSATTPGALAEVDVDRARALLGDESARSLARLAELARMMEEAGLIENRGGRLELTPRGMRKIGQHALSELFAHLSKDRLGRHQIERTGTGHERSYETKPYEFGDQFNLSIERTVRNAIQRAGGGTPVSLSPEDFEVERTESVARTSTVLLLDLSLSMPMKDNFLAAKKVAMALHSLITTQYPRDFLGIVGFSSIAREIKPVDLPEVSWDFVYGTNMQHALMLARKMLSAQTGTRQVIMVTDGEPTAHLEPGMEEPFFHYPPAPATVQATLAEVLRCTRDNIRINVFMLDATAPLREFVERMTKMNRGRAFFTTSETLGDFVLVDFIEQRRSASRGRAS
ncbi:MAG TPA: hypothetical protein VMY34_01180 [Acidimicrobiales bacterium]|nr:hypothetical protein [Acidimicrobiales bacterium]